MALFCWRTYLTESKIIFYITKAFYKDLVNKQYLNRVWHVKIHLIFHLVIYYEATESEHLNIWEQSNPSQ